MVDFSFRRASVVRWMLLGFLSQAVAQENVNPPPLPSQAKPFTEFFRKLLSCTPAEQETLLAVKPVSARVVLQKKLEEYRALPPEEREARLRMLDLRSYLSSLLLMPPSNRVDRLAGIPEGDRPLVEARLQLWDRLPADLQKEVRENEMAITYVVIGSVPRQDNLVVASTRRLQIESAVGRWKTLPRERQVEIYAHFQRIFATPPPKRPPMPVTLTVRDRQQMQLTLKQLDQMPSTQRTLCLSGFQKFTALSEQERSQFLRNAAQWQAMSVRERQTLSNLAHRLPPAPPGLLLRSPSPPPGVAVVPSNRRAAP